jgi:solute carrier family 9B (sodium/hydrogen exchanger), member 1/2
MRSLTQAGGAAVRLTACPGIVEAICVGFVSMWVFGMPPALGLTLGFILAAVSPAVVVSGMFDLQTRGYGVKKGIPSIIVAAASFDDVLAITGPFVSYVIFERSVFI